MKQRRAKTLAAMFGVAVIAIYAAGALWTGTIDPFARRPVLDGLSPPPPYRWVSPPPDVADRNQTPGKGSATVTFKTDGQSAGRFISTTDGQVTVIIGSQTFARPSGSTATGVAVEIDPLAPVAYADAPNGLAIAGNVYRISGTYVPDGGSAEPAKTYALHLQYPAVATSALAVPPEHTILYSPDGKAWTKLTTTDSPVALSATAPNVTTLGLFAVATPTTPSSGPSPLIIAVVAGLFVTIIVIIAFASGAVGPLRRQSGMPSLNDEDEDDDDDDDDDDAGTAGG
jgi:hypothetical protein